MSAVASVGSAGLAARWARTRRLHWLWEFLVVFCGYSFYEEIRARIAGNPSLAASNARHIVRAERFLHLYVERNVQHTFVGAVHFLQFWDIYYGTVHFAMPIIAMLWLYRTWPARYRRWRNILALVTVLALAGFAWYPLMPPRLMPSAYGFVDTAARYGGMGIFDKGSMKDVENLYAAMPSLHIGWSTWSACALFPAVKRPWVKALVCLDPLLTLFAIVVTANHWILDAVAGLVWLALAYLFVTWVTRRWFPSDESLRLPWRWSVRAERLAPDSSPA